jgi:hypothetical protein
MCRADNGLELANKKIRKKRHYDVEVTHATFPRKARMTFHKLRLEFLTKTNINEEAYKKSSVHMIMKCDQFEL